MICLPSYSTEVLTKILGWLNTREANLTKHKINLLQICGKLMTCPEQIFDYYNCAHNISTAVGVLLVSISHLAFISKVKDQLGLNFV